MTAASAGRLGTVTVRLLPVAAIGAVSIAAADSVARWDSRMPKPLAAVLLLAWAAILLSIDTTQLFFGWLFLAPLFQESASNNRVGHILALAVYTAPPLVLLVKLLATQGSRPVREWVDWLPALYLVFLVASLGTTASSELHHGAAVGTVRGLYQNVGIGIIVYYLVVFWRGRGLPFVAVARTLLVAALLQAVMAVVEWPTHRNLWHDTSWQRTGDDRAIATLANPAITGAFVGVGIVLALAVLCWKGPTALRRLAVVMLVVGVPALYATKTRGPILATVIAALLILLLSRRSRLAGLGVLALVSLLLVAFWPQIRGSSVYQTRLAQKQNVDTRLVLQEVSFKLIERKPIFGWGYNSFDRVKFDVVVASGALPAAEALQSTSHDTFLTIFVEYGAVGFLLFLVPWVVIGARALRRVCIPAANRWLLVAALGSILLLAVNAATLDYRFFSFVPMLAWFFLGLLRRELARPGAVART
jgi:O-antigen ligase